MDASEAETGLIGGRELSALVDAHLHFWEPAARHHEWLRLRPALDEVPGLWRARAL